MILICDYIIKSSLRDDARCWCDWVHTMVKSFKPPCLKISTKHSFVHCCQTGSQNKLYQAFTQRSHKYKNKHLPRFIQVCARRKQFIDNKLMIFIRCLQIYGEDLQSVETIAEEMSKWVANVKWPFIRSTYDQEEKYMQNIFCYFANRLWSNIDLLSERSTKC